MPSLILIPLTEHDRPRFLCCHHQPIGILLNLTYNLYYFDLAIE